MHLVLESCIKEHICNILMFDHYVLRSSIPNGWIFRVEHPAKSIYDAVIQLDKHITMEILASSISNLFATSWDRKIAWGNSLLQI